MEALVEKYEDMLKDAADTISNQQMLIRELKQYIVRHTHTNRGV